MRKRAVVRLAWRLIAAVLDPFEVAQAARRLRAYPAFVRDAIGFAERAQNSLRLLDLWPRLGEQEARSQSGGDHYFFQDVWALRKLTGTAHPMHVDVGSRLDGFVAQATALKRVIFVDVRAVNFDIPDLLPLAADATRLPFPNAAVSSLSCLHVLEHIGLGRYGDRLDPMGTHKAAAELARVLAPGGDLYVGMPVGKPRVQFNAQRILDPLAVDSLFPGLRLHDFAAVDDAGRFHSHCSPHLVAGSEYACGLFHFRRC